MKHNYLCSISVLLIIMINVIVGFAQQNTKTSLNNRSLTAEDFINNKINRGSGREDLTLLIEVNPKLPLYKFHLVPNLNEDKNMEGRHNVGYIEISKDGSEDIDQKIDIETFANSSWLTNSFEAKDINFDGYLDIAVLDDHGAKWGRYRYWLFDNSSGLFIQNSLTEELGSLSHNEIFLDSKAKKIHTTHLIGPCPPVNKIHKIINGHLVLILSEESTMDCSTVITKKRIKGKMRVIKIRNQSLTPEESSRNGKAIIGINWRVKR